MIVTLSFVPPGGGEVDYELQFDLPAIPQAGNYISIADPEEPGSRDFIVRRVWWALTFSEPDTQRGAVRKIVVECEFAVGGYASASHKRACENYGRSGRTPKEFDVSCY